MLLIKNQLQSAIQNNPIFVYYWRHAPPTIHWFWFGGIVLIGFIGSIFFKESIVINWLVFLCALTIVTTPIGAIWNAALLTCWLINSEAYQLISVTTIANEKLFIGYVLSVFYRLRSSLVLLFGIIPSIIVRLTDTAYNNYNECIYRQVIAECQLPSTGVVFHWFIFYCIAMLAAIGVLFLGTVLAITLSLWIRNHYVAALATLTVLTPFVVLFFLLQRVSPLDNDPVASLAPAIVHTMFLYILIFAVAFAGISIVKLRSLT